MRIKAKARLTADQGTIENKKKQIENLKRSLPSKDNRRSMSDNQKLNTRKQILNLQTQIVDERLKDAPKKKEHAMYSFLVESRILPEDKYQFFDYKGSKPVTVEFRGKPIEIKNGTRFGVRPSTNGKNIRLIFPSEPTKVITISMEIAKQLAKGLKGLK